MSLLRMKVRIRPNRAKAATAARMGENSQERAYSTQVPGNSHTNDIQKRWSMSHQTQTQNHRGCSAACAVNSVSLSAAELMIRRALQRWGQSIGQVLDMPHMLAQDTAGCSSVMCRMAPLPALTIALMPMT